MLSKDRVSNIIDYECGEMGQEDMIAFFQQLIDDGSAWTLQGHYGLCIRWHDTLFP
jgi:hypothetical protein